MNLLFDVLFRKDPVVNAPNVSILLLIRFRATAASYVVDLRDSVRKSLYVCCWLVEAEVVGVAEMGTAGGRR